MKKKISIDAKTARQLENLRVSKGWSWKEMYAYYLGLDFSFAEKLSPKDIDAFRKQIERKKNKVNFSSPEAVLQGSNDKSISYDFEGGEMTSASGTVYLNTEFATTEDLKVLLQELFKEFKLSDEEFDLVKYNPSLVNNKFKVTAKFEKKTPTVVDERSVVERYTRTLQSIGSIALPRINMTDAHNLLVINLADIHWNKLPYVGFNEDYLNDYEQIIYDSVHKVIERARLLRIDRAVVTLGHDFFQTNDSKGRTKKGTDVSHITDYFDMFESGMRILGNILYMIGKHYITDCYYVLANHDADSGWHASRELKLMYSKSPTVNVFVDKLPFRHIEWGSTLVELIHQNTKRSKSSSKMAVTAREAWGRTKYHYSVGGHLHGEYATKEQDGVVAFGSRALTDTDEWHYIEGYLGNIRGLQAYVFNDEEGLIATLNANL